MNATSTEAHDPEPQALDSKSLLDSIKDAMDVFQKFSRPYAIIDTVKLIIF